MDRHTPDSAKPLPAPETQPSLTSKDRLWETPRRDSVRGPLTDDPRQAEKYFEAWLARERATPLSPYGASYRALERGEKSIHEHAQAIIVPTPPVTIDAAGVRHLDPSWEKFDPDLPRSLKRDAKDADLSRRWDSDGRDSDEPRPTYRGVKSGRKIVGVGRPVESSSPTFYLPKKSEAQDTLGQDSLRLRHGGKAVVPDTERFDTISSLIDMARFVVLGVATVDALAASIARLQCPDNIRVTIFQTLNHTQRRKLGKLLKGQCQSTKLAT